VQKVKNRCEYNRYLRDIILAAYCVDKLYDVVTDMNCH
jgi:hypothetical protein